MSDIRIICGFCDLLAGLLRRVMCAHNRRLGSSDTCYRELDEQDTVRSDARQHSIVSSEELSGGNIPVALPRQKRVFYSFKEKSNRQKQLPTPIEDCYPKQVEMLLSKSSSWNFDTHLLDLASGGQCLPVLSIHLFEVYGLIKSFNLVPEKCMKLFKIIEEEYHNNNAYHNSTHAADVTQAAHCFLQQSPLRENITNKLEIMALLLAAMTHDIDHPGVNHSFLLATRHPLAIMYNEKTFGVDDLPPFPQTKKSNKKKRVLESLLMQLAASKGKEFVKLDSPAKCQSASSSPATKNKKKQKTPQCSSILEHHHWRMAYSCILQSGIFDHMPEQLPEIKELLKSLILATDITRQDEYLNVFQNHLRRKTLDLTRADHRLMVLQMALKTADISNPGRPWYISWKWSHKVCAEFFAQGDEERLLALNISKFCDRTKNTVPRIQIDFIRFVVAPLYREWNNFLGSSFSRNLLKNLLHNESEWRKEDLQPGFHPTTISDIFYSEADLVECSLGTSTNVSGSVDLLLPVTPAMECPGSRYAARSARRSSNSPIRRSNTFFIRRFSAPIDFFRDQIFRNPHKDSIPEDKLREDLQAMSVGVTSDEQTTSNGEHTKRNLKEMSPLNRAVTIITERKRRQANRVARERQLAVDDDNSSSSNADKSVDESPRRSQKFKVTTLLCDSPGQSDDEASSDDKVKRRLKSFVLTEESTSSSASLLTSSSIPISGTARLVPSLSNTPSALSSESRLFLSLHFEKPLFKKVKSSCELMAGLKPSITVEVALKDALVVGLAKRRGRRGSAPAPVAASDQQQLACNLSLHQLGARAKHSASCHQSLAAKHAPAQVRRGSLPVEVTTGSCISAV